VCKLPDLKDYLKQQPEERDETAWQFMSDVKTTLGWHWKAGAAVVSLLLLASSTGVAVMYRVGDARDEKLQAISDKVDGLAALHSKADLRWAADSAFQVEVRRWMDRQDGRRRSDRR